MVQNGERALPGAAGPGLLVNKLLHRRPELSFGRVENLRYFFFQLLPQLVVITFHIESRSAEALLLLQFKASQAERVGDLPKHQQHLINVLSGIKLLVKNRQGVNANRGDRPLSMALSSLSVTGESVFEESSIERLRRPYNFGHQLPAMVSARLPKS